MYLQVADETIRVPCIPSENLSNCGSETFEHTGLVEDCSENNAGNNRCGEQATTYIERFCNSRCSIYDSDGPSTSNPGNVTFERSGKQIEQSELGGNKRNNSFVDFIFEHLCSPPELVEETECYLDTKFTSWKPQNRQNAITIVNRKIRNMSVAQIQSLLNNSHECIKVNHLHLAAVNSSFLDYYYSVDETVEFLLDLLRFQLDELTCDEDDIADFFNVLWRWLNRQNGKKNAIQLVGPPTSYKSAFGTLIGEAMISPGYCSVLNKNERFSLENLVDRRVGIMDDPSFASDQIETLLTIFSGDKTSVNVKYQPHKVLTHTPILILSNRNMFGFDARFKERVVTYHWKRYDVMITKKLNPLAVHFLFNKYVTE
ncbi:MAG: nonstructural protein 1 [Corparats virus 3]|nr:MAG: nonstructural protein 1 [Corparats virus 3]